MRFVKTYGGTSVGRSLNRCRAARQAALAAGDPTEHLAVSPLGSTYQLGDRTGRTSHRACCSTSTVGNPAANGRTAPGRSLTVTAEGEGLFPDRPVA